jgi:type I restriction enzyme S subunit
LADKKYFNVLGSGVNYFKGLKYYYSTSSVDGSKVIGAEGEFTFFDRPSRANMQPIENSVWFAKMKNTLKVINTDTFHNESVIFSTGFCGVACNNASPDFLEQFFLSEEFNTQKDNLSEGSTQQAINNSKLKEIKIHIPDDINEQKKIAEILTKVDEAIENTEALIQK